MDARTESEVAEAVGALGQDTMTPAEALMQVGAGYGETRQRDRGGYMVPDRATNRKKGGRMGMEGGSLLVGVGEYVADPSRNRFWESVRGTNYRMEGAMQDSNALKNPWATPAPMSFY